MTNFSGINSQIAHSINGYRLGKLKPITMSEGASGEKYIQLS